MDLHTSLPLPEERETVLHFCEIVQKEFPDMGDFYRRDSGEYVLEGNREEGSYRWLELSTRRLSSGNFNPADAEAACRQHAWVVDRSRYFLGLSHLDVESLDLVYGFNLEYVGNRDAIVSEALLGGSCLAALSGTPNSVALNFEPSLIVALDPDCGLQARLSVETRNSSFQVRTGDYEEEPISVYFTIRGYPRPGRKFDLAESLKRQAEAGEELVEQIVLPKIVRAIASAIAAAQ
jgi:hypothetical protein